MIEIKFTCNICNEIFVSNDSKIKTPLGWGAVTPTLRVNMPDIDAFKASKKDGESYSGWTNYRAFENKCLELKNDLRIKAYHVCHNCLQLGQDKILKIEQKKKRSQGNSK
jgi:hypothetical protein